MSVSEPDRNALRDRVSVLVPKNGRLETLRAAPDLPPFDPQLTGFVGALSRALMKVPGAREFPEIISLAHWMRPRAIVDLQAGYDKTRPENTLPMARGLALHFAPGNVDTIFLYSALLAILTGNKNIVRVSARPSPQIDLLIGALNQLLEDPAHKAMSDRLMIVRYDHDDQITQALSDICDLRVIWGGDQTVQKIRGFALSPRARDVSFPNRWSLATLSAKALTEASEDDLAQLATNFVNDAYWFGQMACSSPRMVIWVGTSEEKAAASARFWPAVRHAAERFAADIAPVDFVNKLVSQHATTIEGHVQHIIPMADNVVSVVEAKGLCSPDDEYYVGQGQFSESHIDSLGDIAPLLDIRSQTIISFGIDKGDWANLIRDSGARIDRIVPFGQALQFGHIWDGMDLLTEFSRMISIEVQESAS